MNWNQYSSFRGSGVCEKLAVQEAFSGSPYTYDCRGYEVCYRRVLVQGIDNV